MTTEIDPPQQSLPLNTFQHLCAIDLAHLQPFARFRRTAIICTISPRTAAQPDTLAGLLAAGMTVARFNLSYDTYAEHSAAVQLVRTAQRAHELLTGRPHPLALVADLKGAEIRIGAFRSGTAAIRLRIGQPFNLTIVPEAASAGTADVVYVDYERIVQVVQPDQRIYIDEGRIALRVLRAPAAGGTTVFCRVLVGGTLAANKQVHLPDAEPGDLPAAQDELQLRRDRDDIRFAVELGMDALLVGPVGCAVDLRHVRDGLRDSGPEAGRHVLVLVKLETRRGVRDVRDLVAAADGLVVMRSMLELEMDAAQVCVVQKMVLAECRRAGKIGVVGTRMLPSMDDEEGAGEVAQNQRPAAGVDIRELANAVLDGADALMLAASTAVGKRPVECVQTVHRACLAAEAAAAGAPSAVLDALVPRWRIDGRRAMMMAAVRLAGRMRAQVVVVVTAEASLAEMVASLRPGCPVVAVVREHRWARRLAMWAGVRALVWTGAEWTVAGDNVRSAFGVRSAVDEGWAQEGGVAVVVSEAKFGAQCTVRVVTIGGEELQAGAASVGK